MSLCMLVCGVSLTVYEECSAIAERRTPPRTIGYIHVMRAQDFEGINCLCAYTSWWRSYNVFRHAQAVSDGDAEHLYGCGSLDALASCLNYAWKLAYWSIDACGCVLLVRGYRPWHSQKIRWSFFLFSVKMLKLWWPVSLNPLLKVVSLLNRKRYSEF